MMKVLLLLAFGFCTMAVPRQANGQCLTVADIEDLHYASRAEVERRVVEHGFVFVKTVDSENEKVFLYRKKGIGIHDQIAVSFKENNPSLYVAYNTIVEGCHIAARVTVINSGRFEFAGKSEDDYDRYVSVNKLHGRDVEYQFKVKTATPIGTVYYLALGEQP